MKSAIHPRKGMEMAEDLLIRARKRAERAVEDMEDGPLKIAAFQSILAKLLRESDSEGGIRPESPAAADRTGKQATTLTGRIIAVKAEGFFKVQRSLSEVREVLGARGWHYPLTTLSGAMQSLVGRSGALRRERVSDGKKKVWRYSNP
jgi:hypothetical protein